MNGRKVLFAALIPLLLAMGCGGEDVRDDTFRPGMRASTFNNSSDIPWLK